MQFDRIGAALAGLAVAIAGAASSAAWGQPAGARKSVPPTCDRANFRLVVDVGHTAAVGGALSARGVYEYEYNLQLSNEINRTLRERGFAKTALLITTDRTRNGLFKRTEYANGVSADLFLSVHHDSVPNKFLEKWQVDGEEHGFSDRFKGHSIFISNDNADRKGSLLFGQLLGREMKARGLQYTPHYTQPFMDSRRRELVDAAAGVYRYDQLIVLRHTRMPAVLLEAGSIINRDEELAMRKPERRTLITASVADAVTAYCAQRPPAKAAGSASAAKPAKRSP
jgi:N-acetylmuramoyl-L-alanine amidase